MKTPTQAVVVTKDRNLIFSCDLMGEEKVMYEKHEMDVVRYEKNIFVVASGVDEGSTRGEDIPVLEDDD